MEDCHVGVPPRVVKFNNELVIVYYRKLMETVSGAGKPALDRDSTKEVYIYTE